MKLILRLSTSQRGGDPAAGYNPPRPGPVNKLAEKLVECAIEDKQGWAFQQIADRLEGKPVQVVDATVDDRSDIEGQPRMLYMLCWNNRLAPPHWSRLDLQRRRPSGVLVVGAHPNPNPVSGGPYK